MEQHSPEKMSSPNMAPSTSAHHSQATHQMMAQREQTRVKMENLPPDGDGMSHRSPLGTNGIHCAVPQLLQVKGICFFFTKNVLFSY
jgi:hypothetical protein